MHRIDIRYRDGLARAGTASIDGESISFPGVYDDTSMPFSIGIEPFSNIPLAAPEHFVHTYEQKAEGVSLVHPLSAQQASSGDIVLVANWHTALDNPKAYVEWLITMKDRHPPDTLWYAPASALPSNVAFLLYTGFDLFDYRAVDLKTMQGLFCIPEGEFPADEWLDAGVCSCTGCVAGDLEQHNRNALRDEIARSCRFLMNEQLRELVEQRCRMRAWQVAALRFLDERFDYVERYAPIARKAPLLANAGESLHRPEVQRFASRVVERFLPSREDVAVLLPCSAKKPYSFSQSHRLFRGTIRDRAHELIITSPLGLVPRELESIYPAAHYDVPVTGYWDHEEVALLTDIVSKYFERHRYTRVLAHLDGGSLEIARQTAERCGFDLEVTCVDRPTSPSSLAALAEALEGEPRQRHDSVRGTASWQFNTDLDTTGFMIKGKWEQRRVMKGKTQLFSLDPRTGLLKPTLEGWAYLGDRYRVLIDDFVPQGDVLVPGVLEIDPDIRSGDEVLVVGERALATGKAVMCAEEMCRSSRGIAVKVRKVKKL